MSSSYNLYNNMRKGLFIFIITISAARCYAQTYIEPIVGYQIDINKNSKFHEAGLGLQAAFRLRKSYELIAKIERSIGFHVHGSDPSFTTNISLPLYTSAAKTIKPAVWYISVDHRFILNPQNKKELFSILLHTGLTFQKITVSYQYDKSNYTILNPDQTQKANSLFIGTGFEYMRLYKYDRLFVQLTIDTAPAANSFSSFSFIAPLALHVGYSIAINKKRK